MNRSDVLAWQNSTGFGFSPIGNPVKYGLVGSSDIFLVKEGGRIVFIEVKTGNSRLSEMQRHFMHKVCNLGCEYILAKKIEDVEHL